MYIYRHQWFLLCPLLWPSPFSHHGVFILPTRRPRLMELQRLPGVLSDWVLCEWCGLWSSLMFDRRFLLYNQLLLHCFISKAFRQTIQCEQIWKSGSVRIMNGILFVQLNDIWIRCISGQELKRFKKKNSTHSLIWIKSKIIFCLIIHSPRKLLAKKKHYSTGFQFQSLTKKFNFTLLGLNSD